jgi:hypothetical protein
LDSWITKQKEPDLSRPEAIRRLVELGLTVKTKAKPTERACARASELAATAIDSLPVGTADADDQASRKRRLLKGPEEFRELRVDRLKGEGEIAESAICLAIADQKAQPLPWDSSIGGWS